VGDILTINGTNFCNNTLNVNAVTVPNTLNVDSIPKNCDPSGCYPCGPLQFAQHDMTCHEACSGSCSFYYSKDYGLANGGPATGCTECSLHLGDPIYTDILCTPVGNGYYSSNNCSVDCERCYTVVGGIITNIDTCPTICDPCDGVELTYSIDTCETACDSTVCEVYYSDGDCYICPLIVGDYLWTDTACSLAPAGFYSPNNCDGGCSYCYEVDGTGKIITVTTCEPPATCREVLMTIIPQEDCDAACQDLSCTTRYTNRPAGQLIQAGDYIYDNSDCVCDPGSTWAAPEGFYKVWFSTCGDSPISPYYNQCVYKGYETCEISAEETCVGRDGP
jgi:hypothetical protein